MSYPCLLHAVLPNDGGVHLWLELVEGHRVVGSTDQLGEGDLPDELLELARCRPLRARSKVVVATPKGRVQQLAVPTAAWAAGDSVWALQVLADYCARHVGASQIPGMSPEAVFVADLFTFAVTAVRAGRVMVQLRHVEGRWYPMWTLSTGGGHAGVLAEFTNQTPGVLRANGGPEVVEDAVNDMVHWIATALLADRLGEGGKLGEVTTTPFATALVSAQPAPKVTGETVILLNEWRRSARMAATKLVLKLSEPDAAQREEEAEEREPRPLPPQLIDVSRPPEDQSAGAVEEARWRVEIGLSVDDGPATTVNTADAPEDVRALLTRSLKIARTAWPPLAEQLQAVDAWLNTGVWMPDSAQLTGNMAADRQLAITLDAAGVGELLGQGAPALRGAGISVLIPRGWSPVNPKVNLKGTPVGQGPGSGKLGLDQVLAFNWDVSVNGQPVEDSERDALLRSAETVVQVNGEYVYLEAGVLQRARKWFSTLQELSERAGVASLSNDNGDNPQGEEAADVLVSTRDVLEAQLSAAEYSGAEDNEHNFEINVDGWAARLFPGLDGNGDPAGTGDGPTGPAIDPPEMVPVPPTVRTPMRDHQRRGLNWLAWMSRHNIGAILADDMGLGKTLQVLALVAWERQGGATTQPTLVVAPTSVVDAWEAQSATHTPDLTVLVDHGPSKKPADEFQQAAAAAALVITTYGTLSRNPERYRAVSWRRVVADEAQNIKNPQTRQFRMVRSIPAAHHIALTGTPVENRLSDLYAIMDFANPGILGSAAAFQDRLAIPIERYQDEAATRRLRRIVEPFILRRVKTDPSIDLNLPDKREHIELVSLSDEQAALYTAYIADIERRIRDEESGRRGIILGALVRIKQICNHPAHYSGDGSGLLRNGHHRSEKVRRLFQLVEAAVRERKKVIIFTQFPSFGNMLVPELQRRSGGVVPMLHGGVSRKERAKLVAEFQRPLSGGAGEGAISGLDVPSPQIMVVSVRAGGTGITLTQASVVIHVDRWWNPAVEDQATDRAYRIGQDKNVDVYKLVTKGTIDERIHDIIAAKRELAGDIIGAGEGWIANLDDADLAELWHLRSASEEVATWREAGDYTGKDTGGKTGAKAGDKAPTPSPSAQPPYSEGQD
ncbi:DEAD/DEAH box helicase [Corynebacterium heidelbergense]|uniref:DEAD/DEAH box helicase n=1 Tax=Corynebacterium heidelbergense TaxID=2055947 RepID=UPI0023597F39|nr:DEAD/DEAH box helicase [Corynebacterium heidelbergense]